MRVVGPSVMTVSCNSSMEISSHICEKINARVHLFDRPQDAGRGQDMTDVLDDRELTVSGMIRHHATVAPMAPAVDFGGRSMTYADLDRIADRIAATLAAMGLAPGDRVLWLGKNNDGFARIVRSEEHTSELPSLMRISYAGFCL